MDSVNDLMASEALRHAVDLQKYSNATVARIIAVMNRADKRLFAELTERLQSMDSTSFSIERLESMLTSVRSLSAQAYAEIDRELTQTLREFVAYEVSYQNQMLVSMVPVQVSVAAISADAVYAAALARPFQGLLLREVWKDLDAVKMKKVRQAISQGFVEGRTTDQIVRDLRGTRARGYADGTLEVSRRDAEAVVRTALGHMAGFAQDRTAEANVDLLRAIKFSATLDLKTSPICRIRDSRLYTPDTHKPIGHTFPWLQGPGRMHFRCRSAQVWILKSYAELGIDIPEVVVNGNSRASMDGQLPSDVSYPDWLKKQSAARQIEVLGPTRAKLMRDGNLPLEAMYNQKGVFKTLEQIRASDVDVFNRAGL